MRWRYRLNPQTKSPRSDDVNTRACQKLFDDALKRIPAHGPEWTDDNESDPGVTLVELFAWLAESLLFRANNIPERDRTRLQRIARRLHKRGCSARVLMAGGSKKARFALTRFIADSFGVDVYRVDLSAVVSKYIGETEKNLRRLFDAGKRGDVLLFFDEADALFGKRSGVKDGHDRCAGQDVAWFLRRLESYEGVVILGTSRRENLDSTARSRFPFVIPVPTAAELRLERKPVKASNSGQTANELLRHSVFCGEPLRRPHYFDGRLLTAEDLSAEQNYHRNKLRQHNLHCHGSGVVTGLEVSTTNEKSGSTLVIEPGMAIDPVGNEVHLCTRANISLPDSPAAIQVGIRLAERFTGSIPAGSPDAPKMMPAQVEEGSEIVLEPLPMVPQTSANSCPGSNPAKALPLARLIRNGGGWRPDRRFKVSRSH